MHAESGLPSSRQKKWAESLLQCEGLTGAQLYVPLQALVLQEERMEKASTE